MSERAKRTPQKRILDILEAIIQKPETATPIVLSRALDIPLPTVYRQLEALSEEKFIIPGPSGAYTLGARLRSLVLSCLADEPQVTRRRAILRKLSGELNETVSLSVPQGAKLVYFDRFESHWPFQINLRVGDSLPLHCCASGKLYLSSFERAAALDTFVNIKPDRRAPNTIVSRKKFSEELAAIDERGYALDDEEWFEGMVGAAVAIRNKDGNLCACLSTHVLTARKSLEEVDADVPYMLNAAKMLERVLFEE